MTPIEHDTRTPERKILDEQIAAEPLKPHPILPPGSIPRPLEAFLPPKTKAPVPVAGIVEDGKARPLDPNVTLPERARVLIVLSPEPI